MTTIIKPEVDDLSKPAIVGVGLYLELVPKGDNPNNKTTQILITPQGMSDKGVKVDFAMMSREVSTWSPRKQWRHNFSRLTPEQEAVAPADQALALMSRFETSLKREIYYGYELRNKPIVFEVTNLDLADVVAWKAPAAALRRIQKARVSLGFPEKLV
jgi:hypothetical protein